MISYIDSSSPYVTDLSDQSRIKFALGYYWQLKRLCEYVDRNIDMPFLLEDAATEVGLSPDRLSHLFIEKTGISFSSWIRHRRVQKATEFLSANNRSIADIALSVGYENIRTFQRSFKKTTGLSPSEFRQATVSRKMSLD